MGWWWGGGGGGGGGEELGIKLKLSFSWGLGLAELGKIEVVQVIQLINVQVMKNLVYLL